MNIRILILPAIAIGITGCVAIAASADNPKPNIVFIMADDLGIGDLGVNGQNARAAAGLPAIPTPNIDALAAQSMSFTRMYSAPICSPSRASLLTGFEMHHSHRDAVETTNGLRGGELDKTWGQMLQSAGYKTGMFGKWHLGGVDVASPTSLGVYDYNSIPTQKGFETVFGPLSGGYRNQYLWENDGTGGLKLTRNERDPTWPGPGLPYKFTEDATTDRVVDMIRTNANGAQPFAAYVARQAPHVPLDWLPTGVFADKPWPLVQQQYAAMVSNLDRNVGRIIAAISDPNGDGDASDSIASDTLVVFTSDNGGLWNHVSGFQTEFFDSNGPYRGFKSTTYEGGIRVPFYVRWDGVTTPGNVNEDRVGSFADIYSTFAELVGQDTPLGLDGASMLSAITNQGSSSQQDAHIWTARLNYKTPANWAIEMGGWKLIRRMTDLGYELYDIANDPYETANLANSRPDIQDALREVAGLEGVFEEPFFQTGNFAAPYNASYTQYKTWAPQEGSTAFTEAANWAGGTQFNRPDDPESLYWNTGPSAVWLATVSNTRGGYRNAFVSSDAKVLAMEVRGEAGVMQVSVMSGVKLDAYNGVRIGSAGIMRLVGGTVATAREVDIRVGGSLTGAGLITGYQAVIAGIPEFQGKKLLEPEVRNAGVIDIMQGASAGLLTIEGDFEQETPGQLRIDIFGSGGAPGVDFDKLVITGDATLGGSIYVDVSETFVPSSGDSFAVLSAGSLNLAGLHLTGPDANFFTFSVTGGADLVLTFDPDNVSFADADFDGNEVVDAADLVIWQQNFGAAVASGDANHDGVVDGADFLTWQRQLGASAAEAVNAAVPEPSGLALGASMAIIGALLRRLAVKKQCGC